MEDSSASPAPSSRHSFRRWHHPADKLSYVCLLGYILVNVGMMATHRQPFFDFAIAGLVFGIIMPSMTVVALLMVQACLQRFSPLALAATITSLITAGCVSYHLVTLV